MRHLGLLAALSLLSLSVACSAGTAQREGVADLDAKGQRASAIAGAEAFFAVWKSRDIQSMVSRTHPSVIVGIGGAKKAYVAIEKVLAQMDQIGMTAKIDSMGPASEVVASGEGHYAVIPYAQLMITEGKGTVRSVSYLAGESRDGGHTWFFVDGSGVKQDREALRELIPDFPESLELPPLSTTPGE